MYGLGISAFNHDSAAVLIKDGAILMALEEERFSGIKHDGSFPTKAIARILKEHNLSGDDLAFVAYYEKPLRRFERIVHGVTTTFPYSVGLFRYAMQNWLGGKLLVEKNIRQSTGFTGDIHYCPHHLSHAACTYYTAGTNQAAILTIDGVGEYTTTSLWHAVESEITELKTIHFPHSLGLLYSAVTAHLGFVVNNDEYKVMGLAAYGEPRYQADMSKLIELKADGSFALDLSYFAFPYARTKMVTRKFVRQFGPARQADEPLTQHHKDMAASLQAVTERVYAQLLNHLYELTEEPTVCVSGGVALNALANGRVIGPSPFSASHIFGVAGDNGAALGAALHTYHQLTNTPPCNHPRPNLALGTTTSPTAITELLRDTPYAVTVYDDTTELNTAAVQLLADGAVGARFVGPMEYGPRALGNRSILANPATPGMKDHLNQLKRREAFRPFGISILEDQLSTVCHLPNQQSQLPHMNTCVEVQADWQEKLQTVVHADQTTRVQSVDQSASTYYDLLSQFYTHTEIPGLVNTSFNVMGQPIVEQPSDALKLFAESDVDFLILENYLIHK